MNARILIVDDEPLYLRLIKVNLEQEGLPDCNRQEWSGSA